MKENNTKPVQVVFTYNVNHSAENNVKAQLIAGTQPNTESNFVKLDDNNKLVRRYSFDDNGGGYRGL